MLSRTHSYLRRRGGTHIVALLLFGSAASASMAVGVRTWIGRSTPASNAPSLARQEYVRKSSIEVELITFRKSGFEPKEMTRPKGQFNLVINNQSQATEQLTFSLSEARGNKLKDVKLDDRGKHRFSDLLDLNPGNYQLTVAEHPEFVCHLTITK